MAGREKRGWGIQPGHSSPLMANGQRRPCRTLAHQERMCLQYGGWRPNQPRNRFSSARAKVAELADAPDLGSGAVRRGGSSPPFRTIHFLSLRSKPLLEFDSWELC